MHIKEFMFRSQITQNKFAKILGITGSTFSKILNKQQKMTADLALAIEEYSKGIVSRDECLFPEKYPDWKL